MPTPTPEIPPLAAAEDYTKLIGPAPAGVDLDALLAAASDMIRSYCGWHIAPTTEQTITVDGSGTGLIILPTLKLSAVLAASIDGTALDVTGAITWSQTGMIARRCGCWPSGFRNVEMTVEHGHQLVPRALVHLACMMVARAAASPTGVVRENVGGVGLTYSQAGFNIAGGVVILNHEQAYLDLFRLPPSP